MPHRNIWIRKEDLAAWDAIEDKPAWLHRHLSLLLTNDEPPAPRNPLPDKPFDLNRMQKESEDHTRKRLAGKVVTDEPFVGPLFRNPKQGKI